VNDDLKYFFLLVVILKKIDLSRTKNKTPLFVFVASFTSQEIKNPW
jgi:hypothetical protein